MYSDISECICYADSKYRIWTVVKIQNGWLVITLLTWVFFNYVLNLSNIDSFLALSFQEKACLEGFFFFFFWNSNYGRHLPSTLWNGEGGKFKTAISFQISRNNLDYSFWWLKLDFVLSQGAEGSCELCWMLIFSGRQNNWKIKGTKH